MNDAVNLAQKAASLQEDDDLSVSYSVVEGSPGTCIAAEAEQESGTIVAMSSHGRSA